MERSLSAENIKLKFTDRVEEYGGRTLEDRGQPPYLSSIVGVAGPL